MKICIYIRAIMKVYPYFYKNLKKEYGKNLQMVFVAQSAREGEDVRKKIGTEVELIVVEDYFKAHWNEFTLEKLCLFEEKYCDKPIWNMIYQDRFLVEQPWEYAVKVTCGYFCMYDELFEKYHFDYYIDETLAILASFVGYTVAKGNGADYCAQMLAKGFDTTAHYYLRDPMQYNCNFDKNYRQKTYSKEIVEKAIDYMKRMEETYVKPGFMSSSGVLPKWKLGFLRIPFGYLKARRNPFYNNPYEYTDYMRYKTAFNGPKFYLRYQSYKKYYCQPDYSDKYVMFPLHFQPEATTLVCAEKYEKQLFFIDQIAKSLPADTKLYVKEHYAVLGHRDPDFYKKLQSYPNVVIINPLVQAKDLIVHADTVITLTGTAGWEALLLGKRVIVCGNVFYDNAPGAIHINDIYLNYCEAIKNWKKPKEGEMLKYLCEHISSLSDGCQCATNDGYDTEENLNKLGISLVNEISRREERRKNEK